MVNFRDGATPGLHPISAKLFRMFFVKLPQNRHPERSASQIDCVTQRLWRGVEGPRRCYLTHAARSFSTTEARKQDLVRYALDGHVHLFMRCNHFPSPVLFKVFELGWRARPVAGSVIGKLRTAWVR